MSSTLVNSLAKVYDSRTLQQRRMPATAGKPTKSPAEAEMPPDPGFGLIETRIESLSGKLDKLIHIQETVLRRLDGMSEDIGGIEREMETLKVDKEEVQQRHSQQQQEVASGTADVKEICQEMTNIMSAVNQRSEQQARKLEGMERLVISIQQVIGFIGETVKSSRITELIFKKQSTQKEGTPPPAKQKPTKDKPAKEKTSKEKPAKEKTSKEKPAKEKTSKEKPAKEKTSKEKPGKGKSSKEKPGKGKSSKEKLPKEKPIKEKPAKEKPTKDKNTGKKLHKRLPFLDKLRDHKGKDGKDKARLSLKGLKSQKKKKPPDTTDTISLKKQALLLEEVQKLNQQNAEKSSRLLTPESRSLEAGERAEGAGDLLDLILDVPRAPVAEQEESDVSEAEGEAPGPEQMAATHDKEKEEEPQVFTEPESEDEEKEREEEERLKAPEEVKGEEEAEEEAEEEESKETEGFTVEGPAESEVTETEQPLPAHSDRPSEVSALTLESYGDEEAGEAAAPGKRRVTEEDLQKEDHKKSRVEEGEEEETEQEEEEKPKVQDVSEGVEAEVGKQTEGSEPGPEEYIIDCSPPPPAPFDHRIVSAKPNQINNFYTINREEILGGGRFGQVHKCVENSSGLTLAAKIIKARSPKEKEIVKNEIQVMNQLNHANLIQLYAAYESRHDIILVMEYVDGGELFDRIIDENYNLTELDTVLFIRQITEGLQYMHQMYILHLDLKPENILCVSRATNKIKIIDFGLARRYKPREKLRVNFGTPEFLAPEVINYEFVSFPTDMWSLGVITYMLLSGLSPFLGEDDNETLNNILACQWSFEEEEFADISEEAKEFISRLLVKSKSWRMSAAEALKHPWLSDRGLHYRLHQKKNKCHSTRAPPAES
ncbi:myosin light chain kinase 2, skeletal/cardiac muscle isoform X2 [Megalops cyprinoides]|uniref:myosin light chain kinase 2, skeletal/cardiac muscle isoform X2 n=1 Tax=Megalops cyprinoides TaxID=118141 RepID=UPI0018652440|nr:myosin light chain kinase 2, skeletal/cardiac muscle isoform X2 [Megalops cyprinoides]